MSTIEVFTYQVVGVLAAVLSYLVGRLHSNREKNAEIVSLRSENARLANELEIATRWVRTE